MKNLLKIILFTVILLPISFFSQEKISEKKDIHNFQTHETKYINKKVKNLLNDLKININVVHLLSGGENPNIITLIFDNKSTYRKMLNEKSNKKPSKIMILIKEKDKETNKLFSNKNESLPNIIENNTIPPKSNEELLKKYLNLTIVHIIANSEK